MFWSKLLVHILSLTPLGLLVWGTVTNDLGPDPQETLLNTTGIWALRLLLITLALSPIRYLSGWGKAIRYRRMLGLYAAFYLLLHLITFLWFFLGWDLSQLFDEIIERPYITVGMGAFVIMLFLSITSTKAMQKRLGKRWKALHKWVYVAGVLAVVHFIWQSKLDLNQPLLYAFILSALLGVRFWWFFIRKPVQNA
ncbi:sulfite oxidase heme-binding subunit YedZ [Pleionea sp. CnH1-48]|uniref:sulfite oxidase heme-binding subunit YedZ n=1 Tax=Pleionea sp. CnH1-48 TaxID=2954494 RepID=UPI0020973917|nr:protein-methionine-sulfoxide reductase heme-binding subunit MsrQ [Pleionea sp. CnH1-48]MCO7225296.1 sulfoxide reductase heme-binding subunit YedZ [Pleionea sp. CnH1-48]